MQKIDFSRLFEPFCIGPVEVPNRLVMPPMDTCYAGPHGEVTDQHIAYYEARARGGVGLIIVEASYVEESGRITFGELGVHRDELIPGLAKLADAIKLHGARAAIQLIHGGIQANVPQPVGPSPIGRRMIPPARTPRELTTGEVENLVECFARAAARAKQAGFDMVEVHGTHGYLVTQFLSPLTNRRADKYGADRALFAIEIVQRIKQLCGSSFPVIVRLCADEFIEGGINLEYAKVVAKRLVDEGGADALDITGGNYDSIEHILPPIYTAAEEGKFLKHAMEIKRVVDVPVISGGLIISPTVALEAVEKGLVDAVFIGRQLIADPDWPRKLREGRLDEVRPCIACNECVGTRLFAGKPVWCAVNPLAGFESRWPSEEHLPKAARRRKVLVVGGGPAGLEAARVAALRGHEVVLVDDGDELGGTTRVSSKPKFLTGDKTRVAKLIDWYKGQIERLGVKVLLRTRATPSLIEEVKPDVVILATGSKPIVPKIPGVENAVLSDDVLLGKAQVGDRVVVVGGGLVGVETAMHLASQGRKVTIVEALPQIARDLEPISQIALLKPGGLLARHGICVICNATVIEVKKNGVEVVIPPLERRFIEADSVVLAVGRQPNLDPQLLEAARKVAKEVYVIGDAKAARKIIDAVHEAFFAAINI
ncbi:MAG: FAD-dependent oxidoreductase [Thermofilaceae archaeon]